MVMNGHDLCVTAYPELALAVDANQSYTYDQLDMVAAYNDLNLLCIEEPLA